MCVNHSFKDSLWQQSEIPRELAVIEMGKNNCKTYPKELGNSTSYNTYPIKIVTKTSGPLWS